MKYLIDWVHGFHDPVLEQLEVAELDGVVDAVVLEVLVVRGLHEVAGGGHGVTVHVGDAAVAANAVVSGRSETNDYGLDGLDRTSCAVKSESRVTDLLEFQWMIIHLKVLFC